MRLLPLAIFLALAVAGCANKPAPAVPDGVPAPGEIVGVVVDDAVRPIKGVAVELTDLHQETLTDAGGNFHFEAVPPGGHALKASHGLYDTVQQTVEVAEGKAGSTVRIQLTRVVFATPYLQVQKF